MNANGTCLKLEDIEIMIDNAQDSFITQELLLFQKNLENCRRQELASFRIEGMPGLTQAFSDADGLL